MIASALETDLARSDQEPGQREQPSPIGQLLGQNSLDLAVRALREDLAMLQAEQERGLSSLGGALEHIGQELGAVRAQLTTLTEPLLATHRALGPDGSAAGAHPAGERAETLAHVERLDRQVALLVRGMGTLDRLRHQTDVHTHALSRLTDLIGELARPRPVEGLHELRLAVTALEQAVAALEHDTARIEQDRRQATRFQRVAFALLGLAATPGLAALAWLTLQRGL